MCASMWHRYKLDLSRIRPYFVFVYFVMISCGDLQNPRETCVTTNGHMSSIKLCQIVGGNLLAKPFKGCIHKTIIVSLMIYGCS